MWWIRWASVVVPTCTTGDYLTHPPIELSSSSKLVFLFFSQMSVRNELLKYNMPFKNIE